jgi:hypothetical protein
LDVMVSPVAGRQEWLLTDLLGRSMGVIRARDGGAGFTVEPGGNARETMKGMRHGPFGSLDEALAAIETHTRGVCRRESEAPSSGATGAATTDEASADGSGPLETAASDGA